MQCALCGTPVGLLSDLKRMRVDVVGLIDNEYRWRCPGSPPGAAAVHKVYEDDPEYQRLFHAACSSVPAEAWASYEQRYLPPGQSAAARSAARRQESTFLLLLQGLFRFLMAFRIGQVQGQFLMGGVPNVLGTNHLQPQQSQMNLQQHMATIQQQQFWS